MSLNGGVFRIDPAPQQARKSVATLPAFVGSNPPGISYARAALFALTVGAWTTPQPIQRGPKVTASGSAAVIAQVPPTRVPLVELASWNTPTLATPTRARLVQDGTPLVVFVPSSRRPSIELAAWSGATPSIPTGRFAPLASVDEPPRRSLAASASALDTAWRPIIGLPPRAPFVVQGVAPAVVTYTPFPRRPIVELAAWAVLPWSVGPSRLIAAWIDPGTPVIPVDPSNPFNIPQGSALPYRFIRHRR